MWVYRKTGLSFNGEEVPVKGDQHYEVGYYSHTGTWFTDSIFSQASDARSRVHYLNGGS